MANLTGFNAAEHKDMSVFDTLPPNKYRALIVASEMKPTKDSTGMYLELKLEVAEGEFAKRNLWARLNLQNKNKEAVAMANRELATICRAVGITGTITDSGELHNKLLVIDVGVEQQKGPDKRPLVPAQFQNRIKYYLPGNTEVGAAAPSSYTAPAAAAAGGVVGPAAAPPWAKRAA